MQQSQKIGYTKLIERAKSKLKSGKSNYKKTVFLLVFPLIIVWISLFVSLDLADFSKNPGNPNKQLAKSKQKIYFFIVFLLDFTDFIFEFPGFYFFYYFFIWISRIFIWISPRLDP
jgi:hypothetical protein